MILSDREIIAALARDAIRIKPDPTLDPAVWSGMRICQLIFEWVDGTPDKGYAGRFAVQGPESKAT